MPSSIDRRRAWSRDKLAKKGSAPCPDQSQILRSIVNRKTYIEQQVLQADGIYAVFDSGTPINLRDISIATDTGPKYKRIAFTSAASAFNCAERLNRLYRTDTFKVYFFTTGVEVVEGKDGEVIEQP